MQDSKIEISGTVENIIYKNDENGYCVARLNIDSGGETVIVGTMPFLGLAENITAQGNYTKHPEHGQQFVVDHIARRLPIELKGICDYLSSGTVKGVGPQTARRLVDKFGSQVFQVLAEQTDRLMEVKGITMEKARAMTESFNQRNTMRMILDYLIEYSLPMWFAAGLYVEYGENAVSVLSSNPYILCGERYGLDFAAADTIAVERGMDINAKVRVAAALKYELLYNIGNGHLFIPEDKLLNITATLSSSDTDEIKNQLENLYQNEEIVCDTVADKRICYLNQYHGYEDYVAQCVCRLAKMKIIMPSTFENTCKSVQQQFNITFAEKQVQAMSTPFTTAISVITGGPGTGKTTTILGLVELFKKYDMEVMLAAPTGRAAKRISELCGIEASTIHRLLEANYSKEVGLMQFKRNENNPLDADVLIIDEASMLDMKLAAAIFRAIKSHTRVVFVGDRDQLPPIGPGSFFSDLVESKYVNTTMLDYIFRQGEGSFIVDNAHRINQGKYPELGVNKGDFYFAAVSSAKNAVENILSLMCVRIPNTFGIKTSDIQVICPTRQRGCGTALLNGVLQEHLNPYCVGMGQVRFGSAFFREGDRVMQVRNNYDVVWVKTTTGEAGTGMFNGDTGTILTINKQIGIMSILFEDREATYTLDELDQIEHAYAVTVHKAQGSEYDAVILPIFDTPERLLNRSILYTAVTRAKKLLIIVGTKKDIMNMVDSDKKNRRYSALKSRIKKYYEI